MTADTKAETPFYCIKYALSTGKIALALCKRAEGSAYAYSQYTQYIIGKDCFSTEAQARTAADMKRVKKIASLKRSIAKLEQMKFQITDGGELS